jgi:hypothetical protein
MPEVEVVHQPELVEMEHRADTSMLLLVFSIASVGS